MEVSGHLHNMASILLGKEPMPPIE